MAGRFVVQKLATGMSRSRAFLVAHGPFARAAAPAASTPPVAGTVQAARYFSRTSMPSVSNPVNPACVDSFGGAREPLSSMASTQQEISFTETMAAYYSRIDAARAARLAQDEASRAALKAACADLNKFVITVTMVSCFSGSCVLWVFYEMEKHRIEEEKRRSLCKDQSGFTCLPK